MGVVDRGDLHGSGGGSLFCVAMAMFLGLHGVGVGGGDTYCRCEMLPFPLYKKSEISNDR